MTGHAALLERTYDEVVDRDPYVHKSAVSMSMLGRCRRQAAYALRDGWPEETSGSGAQAYLGTAIHHDLLVDLASKLNGEPEVPVGLELHGVQLTGTADLVLDAAVVDLKTVSQFYYQVVSEKVPFSHRLQVTGYAAALGRTHCVLLYVNRSDGSRFAVEWDADEYWPQVDRWLRDVSYEPEAVLRDEKGPGLSMVCDSCPFAERCWGPVEPFQKPQGVIVNEYGVEMALESYADARSREKAAKAEKDYWREALVGQESAPYGAWELSWSRSRSKEVLDTVEAERLITELGMPVPVKLQHTKPSINVHPNRKKETDD